MSNFKDVPIKNVGCTTKFHIGKHRGVEVPAVVVVVVVVVVYEKYYLESEN